MSILNKKTSKLKSKVKRLQNEILAVDALAAGSPKQQFIDKYGIQMQMPANYIYEAIFYRPDPKYVITANCQIFPSELEFYDYNKIDTDEDPKDNEFEENEQDISNCLAFKTYGFEGDRYHQVNYRICNSHYQNKICFSEDKKRVAIFRQRKNKEGDPINFKTAQNYVIDVFDCSKIDFFLRKEPLSPQDQDLLFTIEDTHLNGTTKFENSFMRFTQNQKYLYISQSRKTLLFYDLEQKDKVITEACTVETIPSFYEYIMNIAIDEYELKDSIIALKKIDFNSIDFIPLAMLQDINDTSNSSSRTIKTMKDINQLKEKFPTSSIRLTQFDIKTASLRFSSDHTQAIYCDQNQNILLELAQDGMKQHQKQIYHLNGKISRHIERYGDTEFLIATANSQDKEICIRHSSDADKKLKFYFRYCEGTVQIRDMLIYDNKVRILVTRDDEEFIIYEWEDFQEKEIFWQRFLESSNYIFEWPYLCYLKGQKHIIIQNCFHPNKAFFFELTDQSKDFMISNMFVTDQYLLYVVVQTKTEYQIFERDLDKCMPFILNESAMSNQQQQKQSASQKMKAEKDEENHNNPIATISKAYINNKSIYKFFVRSHSAKEIFSTNQERIIFFLCNFKIYCIIGQKITVVDSGYKFRAINTNLISYNTVDNRGRKTNEIKYLSMADSDYQITRVYEESDGKLVEFLVQDGQLLILAKPEKSDQHALKIFDVNASFQVKLKYQIMTSDETFIGNLQTINYFQDNMIPAFNDMYTIVFNGQQPLIHHYKEVMPVLPHSGNQLSFYAPLLNPTYRKMLYFITNKKFLKPKRAIILPYLIDNYTVFNKRTNVKQFCQFHEYRDQSNMKLETEIICYVPLTQQMLHYNLKGQLIRLLKLDKLYENYGDTNLTTSPNGRFFLAKFEDELTYANLYILKVYLKTDQSQNGSYTSSPQLSPKKTNVDVKSLSKMLTKTPNYRPSEVFVDLQEHIKVSDIEIPDECYKKIGKTYLSQIFQYFKSQQCEIIYRLNNNLDLMIGFLYNTQTKQSSKNKQYLKELFFLKNIGNGKREFFKVRLEQLEIINKDKKPSLIQFDQDNLKQKLLSYSAQDADLHDKEYSLFLEMKGLQGCYNFTLTDEKIIVWSKDKIFHGALDHVNSNNHTINLEKSKFEIENIDEAYIKTITSSGQNQKDIDSDNYYIYIKIILDNSYASLIKYNIKKDKEFSAFDCHIDAQVFFDTKSEGYILDHDSIIDIDQGIPLYFFKTGMNSIDQQYLMNGIIDRGARFCSKNQHFLIRNKFYIPYSFFILVLIENNRNKIISNENYDPDAFYQYEGATFLHRMANNYKAMEFILNKYAQSNQILLNMIFLKDANGDNVLQLAMKYGNTRVVKLILDKLSNISINNIHALKTNFTDLLNYNGFEDYLRLCFFDTNQMVSKQIFSRKFENESDNFFIAAHNTSFLDKEFYRNFQDSTKPSKQVIIRALDAGWILKSSDGIKFLIALSESENMDYFAIDTVKLVVKYQWSIMKTLIIKWLFIPFIFNMILYNVYCIYTYENQVAASQKDTHDVWNVIVQVILILYSVQTISVEFKQIMFHKREYLQSFWNILDLTTAIMAPLTVILDFASADPTTIRPLMAVTNLIFYMRFFYFLRIFDSSAHLVRTIIEITADIKNFLFIFFLGIVGFGQGFYILSNNNNPEVKDSQFIESFFGASIYSYRMSLGDFQLDPLENSTDTILIWSLYIVCSLFTTIIMLNMLVAIMGDSFNRVNEQSENQRVREHLQLIVENDFLMDRKKIFGQIKYLIEIKDDVEEADQDAVTKKIEGIEKNLAHQNQESKHELQEMKEIIKQQSQHILTMKSEVTKIKDLIRKTSEAAGLESERTVNTQDSFVTGQSIRE